MLTACGLPSKKLNMFVIMIFARTEDPFKSDKDLLYQQFLSNVFDGLLRHDLKLILGGLNEQVTSDFSRWPGVISEDSLHS